MDEKKKIDFPFGWENYRLLIVAVSLIIIGFLMMMGGGSEDPNEFSPELFSARRITVAPIVVIAGFVVGVFAIMKKAKD